MQGLRSLFCFMAINRIFGAELKYPVFIMEVIQVSDRKTIEAFHQLPIQLYRNDPNWVAPFRLMIEDIFDPGKNAGFVHGDARRWLVKKDGRCVGRIAAFYDRSKIEQNAEQTGNVGFFESVDDDNVARLLFGTAEKWLHSEGFTAMDGPVNFGENFFNWGLLVDGFQQQGFGMQYNPAYYRRLFESYGFKTYYQQFSYHLDITSPDLPQRFWKIAEWVAKKPDYSFRTFSFQNQDRCIEDFLSVYEQAWNKHSNFKPIDRKELKALIGNAKIVLEEEFIWYVFHKDEPIAFFMMIPDLNQILKHLKNGKLNLYNILKLLYLKQIRTMTRCRVLVMGVIPRFQGAGIESGIFWQLRQVFLKKPWYNEMELSWVGDFNPKMISLFSAVGSKYAKTHETLRCLFDRSRCFERLPIIQD